MNTVVSGIADPYTLDIKDLDPSDPRLFEHQLHWDYFKRLREEDPVHFVNSEEFGPYWSITKFQDIMFVDSHHQLFSSEPSIVLGEPEIDFQPPMFIAMDSPKHDVQRKAVAPAITPARLAEMEVMIRRRICTLLDSLPVGEEFNWVDLVSIELTTQMLATLFDFPFEDRAKLTYWSDVTTTAPNTDGSGITEEERRDILLECLECFAKLWKERAEAPLKNDFISLLSHNPDTMDMEPLEYLGNLMLLIVGGNDTTRNSMSAGVLALHDNPKEFAKLKADPALIPNMVSEIIRWQTPLGHMRRIANEDVEVGGKMIKKGDKVVMWYISGNRDEEVIPNADAFIIDRPKARHHVSFGFGIHRCMGNRLAEMQLKILWEELLSRFERIEVIGEPLRVNSNFVMGYTHLPVILHPV
jgi:cytochrome P450